MYLDFAHLISAAELYENLGWALVELKTNTKLPKRKNWPTVRVALQQLQANSNLGLNLGLSNLIDVEADGPNGQALLAELLKAVKTPCWRSRRGTHYLFRASERVSALSIKQLEIEFRTGRQHSVLPPSTVDGFVYQWIVNPTDCQIAELPDSLFDIYQANSQKSPKIKSNKTPKAVVPQEKSGGLDALVEGMDFLEEALTAGLQVVGEANEQGDYSCHVPASLRSGNADEHPSGSFNPANGYLHDFATDETHGIIKVLAALREVDFGDVVDDLRGSKKNSVVRLDGLMSATPGMRIPLEEAREDLLAYFEDQLNRPVKPKTLHIVKGPPGLGKTYGLSQALAKLKKRAIFLTLENQLADEHQKLLSSFGGSVRRMPVPDADGCIDPDAYNSVSRRGYRASQSAICNTCPIKPKNCPYLLSFSSMGDADVLCGAAIYHTHDGFYGAYGNETRPLLVFDENCVDILLEPQKHSIDQWTSWVEMLERELGAKASRSYRRLLDWLVAEIDVFRPEMTDSRERKKYKSITIPAHLRDRRPRLSKESIRSLSKTAHKSENKRTINLVTQANYLLNTDGSTVILERISRKEKDHDDVFKVRFRKKNPLPVDKEVFLLDATANEDLTKAIAPDWETKVWDCPPLFQKGTIIQVMDRDVSRSFIRRQVERHRPHNLCELAQLLDWILSQHDEVALVAHKDVIDQEDETIDILRHLRHFDRITTKDNFPCRGVEFQEDTLIVLGTPYKDEATILEIALAIWGEDGLPKSKYEHRLTSVEWQAYSMGYEEPHLRPIQDFVVSADLVQAIGRTRPLQRNCTVYVITNAPINNWEIKQVRLSNMTKVTRCLRKDAADRYLVYKSAALKILRSGEWTTNKKLCDECKETEISVKAGQGYWKRLVAELAGTVELQHGAMRQRRPQVIRM